MRKLVVAQSVAFATTVIPPLAEASPTSHYVASLGSDRYYTVKSGHRVHSPGPNQSPSRGSVGEVRGRIVWFQRESPRDMLASR